MKKKIIDINNSYWQKKYSAPNVEGFVFRFYNKLLKHHIKNKKIKILDFGCGEGANLDYFYKQLNFEPYGVDISNISIKVCKRKFKKIKNNFKLINFKPEYPPKLFFKNQKYDIITAIQSLYYLDNHNLELALKNIEYNLNEGGFVFFTMVSRKSYFWSKLSNKKTLSNGMTKVDLGNKNINYFNFIKNKSDLIKKFKLFKKLNVGFYDYSLIDINESTFHYTFFGKKIKK